MCMKMCFTIHRIYLDLNGCGNDIKIFPRLEKTMTEDSDSRFGLSDFSQRSRLCAYSATYVAKRIDFSSVQDFGHFEGN